MSLVLASVHPSTLPNLNISEDSQAMLMEFSVQLHLSWGKKYCLTETH